MYILNSTRANYLVTNSTLSPSLFPSIAGAAYGGKFVIESLVAPGSQRVFLEYLSAGGSKISFAVDTANKLVITISNDTPTPASATVNLDLATGGIPHTVYWRLTGGTFSVYVDQAGTNAFPTATSIPNSALTTLWIGRATGGTQIAGHNMRIGGIQVWATATLTTADRNTMMADSASPIRIYTTTSTPAIGANATGNVSLKNSLTAETGTVLFDTGIMPTFSDDSAFFTGEAAPIWAASAIAATPASANLGIVNLSVDKTFVALGDSISVANIYSRYPFHALERLAVLTGLPLEKLILGADTLSVNSGNPFDGAITSPDTHTWAVVDSGTNYEIEKLESVPTHFGLPVNQIMELHTGAGPYVGDPDVFSVVFSDLILFSGVLSSWLSGATKETVGVRLLQRTSTQNPLLVIGVYDVELDEYIDLDLSTGVAGEISVTSELFNTGDGAGSSRGMILSKPVAGWTGQENKTFDLAGFVVRRADISGGIIFANLADASWPIIGFGVDAESSAGTPKQFDDANLTNYHGALPNRGFYAMYFARENKTQAEYETVYQAVVNRMNARHDAMGKPRWPIIIYAPHVHEGSNTMAAGRIDAENHTLAAAAIAAANDNVGYVSGYLLTEGASFDDFSDGFSLVDNDANGAAAIWMDAFNTAHTTTYSNVLLDSLTTHPLDFDAAEFFGAALFMEELHANASFGSNEYRQQQLLIPSAS